MPSSPHNRLSLKKEFPDAIPMSAINPKDIDALHERRLFLDNMTQVDLVVSYGKEGVLAEIRKNVHVLKESYDERGVCLTIKATRYPYRSKAAARFVNTFLRFGK